MIFSTALLTGGTGFIGTALLQYLTQIGVRVTLLTRPGASTPSGCDVVSVSSLCRDVISSALAGRTFDVIFHLAAYGVAPSDRDPDLIFGTNVAGTDAIVSVAPKIGVRSIVYLGSCSEYRHATPGQLISEDASLGPSRLYGGSKVAAGLWGQALADHLGIPFQWLRLFNVFGPGEPASRLIPAIVARLKANETVALSRGDQVRDFLYVDDVARAIVLAAEASLEGRHGPFNLCSGQPVSVKEIALAVATAMNKPYDLLAFGALSYRPDDVSWLVGNPDKFQRATGFVPRTSLAAGIERMLLAEASSCGENDDV